ncbi:ABC transporter substrate-binding protein [Natrononativus amylolyticus]|uniref:ABC transporter substrate-binding protein n=1 Tax=Natrononativus amylolyticus TaxID=2963434 RepID=UPI0020CC5C91|nr:ABC transporter substrate-binding protein [Natrononativus amylolyticus]
MSRNGRDGTVTSIEELFSRRQILGAGSAAVGASLAGCLSGGEEDDSDDSGNGGNGDDGPVTITMAMPTIPDEMNFNTWASGYPWDNAKMFMEFHTRYFRDGTVQHDLVDDWSYDEGDQALTVTYSEDFYWWNGDQVTAEDAYWYNECARLFDPEGSDWEDVELADDQTLVYHFKEPQSPQLIEYAVGGHLGPMLRSYGPKYQPWAEELEDLDNQDERLEVQERMGDEMPLHISTVMEEGLGAGPFELVDYDTEGMRFEKFDQHPYADQIEIDEFEWILAADEALAQRIMAGDVDAGFSTVENWVGEGNAPDHAENVGVHTDTFMRKIEFFHNGPGAEHLDRIEVRRAIAHVLDNEHIASNYPSEAAAREQQTGITSSMTENLLGDYVDDFIDYPHQGDEDGAIELMESAGYELDGDQWVDEDGDSVTLELVIREEHTNIGRTVSDQLSSFGFEIDFTALEGATYNANTEDRIDFDMTVGTHGGQNPHPFWYFRINHTHSNDLGDYGVVERNVAEGATRAEYNGREMVLEIPEEVGAEDLSGGTQEINLFELHNALESAQSEEETLELTETLTWYWNYQLPQIDLIETQTGSWGNTQEFEFNSDDVGWQVYRAVYHQLKRGKINPL